MGRERARQRGRSNRSLLKRVTHILGHGQEHPHAENKCDNIAWRHDYQDTLQS